MSQESKASRWLAMGFMSEEMFGEQQTSFSITYKSFYETHGYLYDQDLSELISSDIPEFDLDALTETDYEFDGTPEEAKAYCVSLGMTVLEEEK